MINVENIYKVSFSLPGTGHPLDRCGDYLTLGHIDGDVLHPQSVKISCGRRECPICYTIYEHRQAKEGTTRIQKWRSMIENHREPIYHYIISPVAQKINTNEEYVNLRKQALNVFKKVVRYKKDWGGLLVFHYYRHPSYRNKREEISPDNPHWHLIGTGYLDEDKIVKLKGTGWIVKKSEDDKGKVYRLTSSGQIYSHIRYAYHWSSQVNIEEDSSILHIGELPTSRHPYQVATWVGQMSYNKLKKDRKETGEKSIYCKFCKKTVSIDEWYILTWIGNGDPPKEEIYDLTGPKEWEMNKINPQYKSVLSLS